MRLLKTATSQKVHAVLVGDRSMYTCECGYHGWPGSDKLFEGDVNELTCKRCARLLGKPIQTMERNCKNCRWIGCRNYGKDRPSCVKHIPENEEIICDDN